MSAVPGYILTAQIRQGPHTVTYRGYREADETPVLIEMVRSPSPTAHALAQQCCWRPSWSTPGR
jgi:hypothetical protein